MYAAVAVDVAAGGTDRLYHYSLPEGLRDAVRPGHLVLVPFGRRQVAGVVAALVPQADVEQVKPILRLLEPEPVLLPAQVALADWLAAHVLCHRAVALRCFLPPGWRRGAARPLWRRVVRLVSPGQAAAGDRAAGDTGDRAGGDSRTGSAAAGEEVAAGLTPRQGAVLGFLRGYAGPPLTRAELARAAGVSPGVVAALLAKGMLREEMLPASRRPAAPAVAVESGPPVLTPEQEEAVAAIVPAVASPGAAAAPRGFLLFGVTGSGKTEVYLRAIEAGLGSGRRSLVLVPEIALTPQLMAVFRGRFGDRVAVLHSALSPGERFDEWGRIRAGRVDVVLGARSALFAPLPDLGLIILDEEHESTYKQEESPRYHARTVAAARAELEGAALLLGSATPSVETFHAARQGRLRLLELPRRVDGRPLPAVRVVDMRKELEQGWRGILSRPLVEAIRERLARREQVILFLNRRGFHTFVLCRECGESVRCPHCDVSLALHLLGAAGPVGSGPAAPGAAGPGAAPPLRCHYCGFERRPPETCPSCGGRRIRYYGTGTQRVEEAVRDHFPGARVLRMDQDTTARKGSHQRIYEQFRKGDADVLVGTQMIAKGWDVPGVTLVGIVNGDTALHLPDFRAGERTFQLVTQVAGRAGRGDEPGEVLLQTYSPDDPVIRLAAAQDYAAFYEEEMAVRRASGYPPFAALLRLLVSHPVEEEARRLASLAVEEAVAHGAARADGLAGPAGTGVTCVGPSAAPLSRLQGRYRWQAILKSGDATALLDLGRALLGLERRCDRAGGRLVLDPDPQQML